MKSLDKIASSRTVTVRSYSSLSLCYEEYREYSADRCQSMMETLILEVMRIPVCHNFLAH